MPHLSTTDNVTTINYTLEWPHFENPSNTTFAGQTQIDICRCPRSDLPSQDSREPGHIYTRSKCVGPEVRFKTRKEELWVLQSAHGPVNMLRPATKEEKERRNQVHEDAEPTVYERRTFLFLSGPCPRGRYQAFATQKWLESIGPSARQHVTSLSLLVQPYEEDCSAQATQRAFAELAYYILEHLTGFKTLCLNIWDDEMSLWGAASEFSILLHRDDVKIIVGCILWSGETREYSNARAFFEAMTTPPHTKTTRPFSNQVMGDDDGEDSADEQEEAQEDFSDGLATTEDKIRNDGKPNETSGSSPILKSDTEDEVGSEDDWTDAAMSPMETEKDWQIL
ncbi:uncharacterized protein J4E87_003940 [Alternaria ethzedia]|uniref:uncharacterized protein n=1 Tax=Alternaria ethzedia TaxID=181014 RepID=UPI0020C46BF0|nr:uncharacterized protein J4E87_003940 [Alternaria ethzedia]KAI4627377.1 hypothetical protein J4E87_003940 [Alternaria ethzedia]